MQIPVFSILDLLILIRGINSKFFDFKLRRFQVYGFKITYV